MALRSFPQVHHPASAMARHRSPRDRPPMSSGATFTLQQAQRQDGRPCFSRRHIIRGKDNWQQSSQVVMHAPMFLVLSAAYPPFSSLIAIPKGDMSKGRPLRAHSCRQACIHRSRTLQHQA
jgi:hypothetical protein